MSPSPQLSVLAPWEAISRSLVSPFFLIPNPITHWILLTQVFLRNSQNSFASVHIHTCQHIQALIISYWTTVIASELASPYQVWPLVFYFPSIHKSDFFTFVLLRFQRMFPSRNSYLPSTLENCQPPFLQISLLHHSLHSFQPEILRHIWILST